LHVKFLHILNLLHILHILHILNLLHMHICNKKFPRNFPSQLHNYSTIVRDTYFAEIYIAPLITFVTLQAMGIFIQIRGSSRKVELCSYRNSTAN